CGISGLFDFSASPEIVRSEIVRCIDLAEDGIHAVLLVLSVRSCFTRQQQAAVQSLLVFFGGKISDYMIETLAMCKSRLVLFDNRTRDPIKKADQLKELLEQVNLVVEKNGGIPYTNDLFKKLKEGAASFPDSKSKFGSSAGHSEQEIKELIKDEMQRSHEEQKSKLKVNLQKLVKLDKQLGKERAARLAAESKVRKAQKKSKDEARKLKDLLEMSMVYDSAVLIVLLSCIIYWLSPSFSLGFTQIQSTSNEIDMSGFVPGNFDYKDVDFRENRSKYRNDPTIMKKLRIAASVKGKKTASDKGKKSVVAISKGKKKEVVKRDPLPKGMKYVIKTVPPHPLRFGISFNRNFATDVEYFVGKKRLKMFKETCFDKDIACRIGNGIPMLCNWFVVGTKPKFEKFMNGMFSKPMKVDQKDKMTAGSLLLDDFDDFTTPPPLGLLARTKTKSDILLAPPSKRRKTNADKKESITDQEKIKGHPYVKEVNEPPSGTSNTITDTINEEAPHEPSLMDFGEQTPTTEQNPPVIESGRDSIQKINVSRGTYHEKFLMKFDMNAIESLVKTYVVIEIDSSNKDVEKNETHGDDLGTPKEHPKNFSEKVSCTVLSYEAFQELIDNIIVGMSIPIVAMAVNSDDLSQNANLPDPSLQTANVEFQMNCGEPSHEIKKLSEILPTYISYSGLLENTERTVWSSLESYKDKMSNVAGDLNDTPFDVEYVEDIAQQVSGSLDCGVFMAAYAEFLSDQMQIPSSNLDAEYLRNRYASLLWNYGFKKAKKIYSSDHDDPP
ncbi:hypothetical protein T459_02396, partial [Capsicum annuum]